MKEIDKVYTACNLYKCKHSKECRMQTTEPDGFKPYLAAMVKANGEVKIFCDDYKTDTVDKCPKCGAEMVNNTEVMCTICNTSFKTMEGE